MNTAFTIVLLISAGVALTGIASWLRNMLSRPPVNDPTPESVSSTDGVLYAFTTGMLPWKKESTRKHWLDYARGMLFHAGIFAGLASLALSPWTEIPLTFRAILGVVLAAGAISGLLGLAVRVGRPILRSLSRTDDYLSPALVTAFILAGLAFVIYPAFRAGFYLVASAMLLYLPFSKVRHFVYFFFARAYFGHLFGHRGVIGLAHSAAIVSKGDDNG